MGKPRHRISWNSSIAACIQQKTFCWAFYNLIHIQNLIALGIGKWGVFINKDRSTGGGGSRLNFGQECAAHGFKMAPLARPIFLKMIPLARLISTSKVPWVAFSGQNLPNFCILLTKIWKKFGFLYRNYRSLTFLWPKLPKGIPLPRLNGRKLAKSISLARHNGLKLAKSIPLARLEGLIKHTLAGGTSPGTFTMEEPPPPPVDRRPKIEDEDAYNKYSIQSRFSTSIG